MSNWTHVAAVARIDNIVGLVPELNFEKHFGKVLEYEDSLDKWREQEEHPERYLPMGSEGPLKMMVWTSPDPSDMARYTVSIFGDLRDHDSPQEIVDWFKDKIKDLWIRQATITVENECNGTVNWTYEYVREE